MVLLMVHNEYIQLHRELSTLMPIYFAPCIHSHFVVKSYTYNDMYTLMERDHLSFHTFYSKHHLITDSTTTKASVIHLCTYTVYIHMHTYIEWD